MIYRYIYKITCTTGSFKDKFYFGQHTTDDLNDGYKGCGILIIKYYKKHPNDYIKEIISFHNSQEELNKAEYDIIHPWLGNELCLNMCEGGKGGPMFKGHNHTEESKRKTTESLNKYWSTHDGPNKGKPNSIESRMKLSKTLKERYANDLVVWNKGLDKTMHPNYDKKRMTDGENKIFVHKDYWGEFIDIGYYFVRRL